MNEAKPSNEQVCRDLRPLFEGMRAPVTLKKVRKRIQAPKRSASVQKLINIFGLEELCNLTLRLLQEGSFLPEIDSGRQTACAIEGTPIQESPVPCSVPSRIPTDDTSGNMQGPGTILCDEPNAQSRKNLLSAEGVVPLFTPVHLPYSLQHTILVGVQEMLEDSLFKYGNEKMRDVIKTKGWDCPQCVELNDWIKILRKRKDLVLKPKDKMPERPLSAVLDSVVQLRHTAVHRQKVTAFEVQSFLEDAEALLTFLDDRASAKDISGLHGALSDHVKDLSAHSNSYRERLRVITKDKQMQAFQLKLEEHLAVTEVLADSQEYERCAALQLQKVASCRGFAHSRKDSCATLSDSVECGHHVDQETFRFCANCIQGVRTSVRTEVEKSFKSRSMTIWLSKMLSSADAMRFGHSFLTRATRRIVVSTILMVLISCVTLFVAQGKGSWIHKYLKIP